MTSVWPALWPPWKRTTTSARSESQSTILPLPSSPHWAPTTTTLLMGPALRFLSLGRALARFHGALGRREMAAAEPAGLGGDVGDRLQAGDGRPARLAQAACGGGRNAPRPIQPRTRPGLRQGPDHRVHFEGETRAPRPPGPPPGRTP